MIEVGQRVVDAVALAARGGRGAHAVEHQREVAIAGGDVIVVAARVDSDVGRAPPVELVEQGTEPVLMLVVDGDRSGGFRLGHWRALPWKGASIQDHVTNV